MFDTVTITEKVPITSIKTDCMDVKATRKRINRVTYTHHSYFLNLPNVNIDTNPDPHSAYHHYLSLRISVPKLLKLNLYENFNMSGNEDYIFDAYSDYVRQVLKNQFDVRGSRLSRIDISLNVKHNNITQTIKKISSLNRLSHKLAGKHSITFKNTQRTLILYDKGIEQNDENVTDCLRVENRLFKIRNTEKYYDNLESIFDDNYNKHIYKELYDKVAPLKCKINHGSFKETKDFLLLQAIEKNYGTVDNFLATFPDMKPQTASSFRTKMRSATIDEELFDLDQKINNTLNEI